MEELKVTGFTEEELITYEKLLDNIRVERTLQQDSYEKGVTEGKTRTSLSIAKKMLMAKVPISQIMTFTGLTQKQIEEIELTLP